MPMNFAKQATNKTRKARKKKMAMKPQVDPRDAVAAKGLMNRPKRDMKEKVGEQPIERVLQAIDLLKELKNGRA
tara:strand:- start:121 stop:342 length:222 start_codon:yes stop_codon:yes gene_type:complete